MANKKRLICADTLLETIHDTADGLADCDQQNSAWALRKYAVRDIMDAPTVDAVEVVRCKDCKHWNELKGKDSGKPVGYGDCRNGCGINGIAYEDSFCSYGERRADG